MTPEAERGAEATLRQIVAWDNHTHDDRAGQATCPTCYARNFLDGATLAATPLSEGEEVRPPLTVTVVVPDHLALWVEDGEVAGTVTMDEGLTATGMLRFWRNDSGVPMIDVYGVLDDSLISRTPVDNVGGIVIP